MVSSSSHLRGYMDTMGNLLPLVLGWIWMSVSNGLGQSDAIANTRVLKDHGFCLVFPLWPSDGNQTWEIAMRAILLPTQRKSHDIDWRQFLPNSQCVREVRSPAAHRPLSPISRKMRNRDVVHYSVKFCYDCRPREQLSYRLMRNAEPEDPRSYADILTSQNLSSNNCFLLLKSTDWKLF